MSTRPRDRKNRAVVDIQHVRYPDHYNRFLHYHCAAILQQAASAENYRPNMRVFTIVILTSGDRHKVDVARINFDPKDLQGRGLNEIPYQILYLCPPYVTATTPEPYREWLRAIQDSQTGEVDETSYHKPVFQEVFQTIKQDLISPAERFRMKDEYGYEEIKQEKFQEGFKEGEMSGVHKTALAMLKEGVDQALIQRVTGLSIETLVEMSKSC